MTRMKEQTQKMIEDAVTQNELLQTLVAFTAQAKARRPKKAARLQELVLAQIEQIADANGRPTGGTSLGDCILTQQHHKIVKWGDRAFCLSEKQMGIIVRENWYYIK